MDSVKTVFVTEDAFLTTQYGFDFDNITYLTQDFYLTSPSLTTTDKPIEDEYGGPTRLDVILGVAMVFLIIPTVTGNALILIAFWKTRRLRTYFNYFICSMAFSDLTIGAINMPIYSIEFFRGRWPFGPMACLIFSIIDHVFVHVSVLSVVVIAIDRYKSLADPLTHLRRKSPCRAILVILTTYLIPIILWTWFVLFRKQGRNENCYTGKRGEFPFNFVTPFFLYLIPLVILASYCIAIYKIIRSRNCNRMSDKMRSSRLSLTDLSRPRENETKLSILSSMDISGSIKRGTLNPVCSTEDIDPIQIESYPGCKPDLNNAPEIGQSNIESTENVDSPNRKDLSVCSFGSENETVFTRESLATSDEFIEQGHLSHGRNDKEDADYDVDTPTTQSQTYSASKHRVYTAHNKMQLKEPASEGRVASTEGLSMSKPSEENRKAVRTLSFIVLALVVSWSPWVIFVFIENICGNNCNVESVYHVSFFWVYVNSLLNPFCYAAANRTYRRVIRDFFRR
nr:muscarinic acetylcholine receptor gar-2-like [Lytechinus pictus]